MGWPPCGRRAWRSLLTMRSTRCTPCKIKAKRSRPGALARTLDYTSMNDRGETQVLNIMSHQGKTNHSEKRLYAQQYSGGANQTCLWTLARHDTQEHTCNALTTLKEVLTTPSVTRHVPELANLLWYNQHRSISKACYWKGLRWRQYISIHA